MPAGSRSKARSAAARSSSTATMSSEGAPRASEMLVSSATERATIPGGLEVGWPKMKRGQLLIVILAVIAVAGVALVSTGGGGDDGGDGGETGPAAPEGAIAVPFAYSPEKEKLLAPLIKRFNSERERGRRQSRSSSRARSCRAARPRPKIAAGELEPVVWSPASSLWGRLLNFEADRRARARGEPVDRPHPARDRDVGALRARRSAGRAEPDRLRADHPAGALEPGLRRVRPPGVRALQARPHQPGLLDLGARGGRGRVLRRHRQEGGPDRAGRRGLEGARASCATSSARSSTTATPRSSSPTRCARRARATPRRWRWRR